MRPRPLPEDLIFWRLMIFWSKTWECFSSWDFLANSAFSLREAVLVEFLDSFHFASFAEHFLPLGWSCFCAALRRASFAARLLAAFSLFASKRFCSISWGDRTFFTSEAAARFFIALCSTFLARASRDEAPALCLFSSSFLFRNCFFCHSLHCVQRLLGRAVPLKVSRTSAFWIWILAAKPGFRCRETPPPFFALVAVFPLVLHLWFFLLLYLYAISWHFYCHLLPVMLLSLLLNHEKLWKNWLCKRV